MIPLLSTKGVRDFSSPSFIFLTKPVWANLSKWTSAFSISSAVNRPRVISSLIPVRLSRRLWQNLRTYAVTLNSRRHFEKSSHLITGSGTATAHVIRTFLRSLFTSFMLGTSCCVGQWSVGNLRNSGPFSHLPFISSVEIPFVTSSATLSLVGQWNHSSGRELLWISPILVDTNGL